MVARSLPAWREPAAGALPSDWTFVLGLGGEANGYNYTGYAAVWHDARGVSAVEIEGIYAPAGERYDATVSSYTTNDGKLVVRELLVIADRPAWVDYSPIGTQHLRTFPITVSVHDARADTMYSVTGTHSSLRSGPDAVQRVTAIAQSLFASPNAP